MGADKMNNNNIMYNKDNDTVTMSREHYNNLITKAAGFTKVLNIVDEAIQPMIDKAYEEGCVKGYMNCMNDHTYMKCGSETKKADIDIDADKTQKNNF